MLTVTFPKSYKSAWYSRLFLDHRGWQGRTWLGHGSFVYKIVYYIQNKMHMTALYTRLCIISKIERMQMC
jgi:hypothetical protein